jgi:hypothetical protein
MTRSGHFGHPALMPVFDPVGRLLSILQELGSGSAGPRVVGSGSAGPRVVGNRHPPAPFVGGPATAGPTRRKFPWQALVHPRQSHCSRPPKWRRCFVLTPKRSHVGQRPESSRRSARWAVTAATARPRFVPFLAGFLSSAKATDRAVGFTGICLLQVLKASTRRSAPLAWPVKEPPACSDALGKGRAQKRAVRLSEAKPPSGAA